MLTPAFAAQPASAQTLRVWGQLDPKSTADPRERVLKKAMEKGLVAPGTTLTDEEIDHLVFLPGFSTAEKVTSVSGRGVGMDVVRRNIEALGGQVRITNTPGKGSIFTVSLPLTLAILDGMIVRVGAESYIVPITSIIETMRPKMEQVHEVQGRSDVMNVRGEFVPLVYLKDIFSIPNAEQDLGKALVVLVESGQEKMGLVVDELIGQQQVVIKSLEANSDPVKGISGATILGDGKVSLIAGVTADLIGKIKAGELVNHVATQVGGKGGGRPDMAQAGGTDPAGLPKALSSVVAWVEQRA